MTVVGGAVVVIKATTIKVGLTGLGVDASGQIVRAKQAVHREHGIGHTDVHMLAFATDMALINRCQNTNNAMQRTAG